MPINKCALSWITNPLTVQLEGYPYHQLPQCSAVAMWAAFHENRSYGLAFVDCPPCRLTPHTKYFFTDFYQRVCSVITLDIFWIKSLSTFSPMFLPILLFFSPLKNQNIILLWPLSLLVSFDFTCAPEISFLFIYFSFFYVEHV